jgi:hypothetical protein
MTAKRGDVVLIKGDERNRGKWKIGIIESFIVGRNGVIRGARLRAGKLVPYRTCDATSIPECDSHPNEDIGTRTTRAAAVEARERIANIARNELDELD